MRWLPAARRPHVQPVAALALSVLPAGVPAVVPEAHAAPVPLASFARTWSVTLGDGSPVTTSSPNEAVLAGAPAVVVGDRAGHVYAFSLASGAGVPGWPATTGGVPVGSTPSVAALSTSSANDTVFVGAGTAAAPHEGGYEAFAPNGSRLWSVSVHNPGSDHVSGIVASLAVGDLQGGADVVAPSIGQEEDAINARSGAVLAGFPWFQADGDYATPAIAPLYGGSRDYVVNGGGQTAGLAYGVHYPQGGHVRVLLPTGHGGSTNPAAGTVCDYHPHQSVESSPAVGPVLASGHEGIVTGTGNFWPGAPPQTDVVMAFTPHCKLVWTAHLDGVTSASPALADLSGRGRLDVVEGTDNQHGGGSVYALNGATGAVLWRQDAGGEVLGGVATADLGAGHQDVVVASTGRAEVLDGRTGALLATVERGVGLQDCPLVTDDPNGTVGVTLAGYGPSGQGVVEHFELSGSKGALVDRPGAWPMFHHDPHLTGYALAPFPRA